MRQMARASLHAPHCIRSYVDPLGGVLLSYANVKLQQPLGRIAYDSPEIHVRVELDVTYFAPRVGEVLEGVVSRVGTDHVALLVLGVFNGSIPPPPHRQLENDETVNFTVRRVHHSNGLLTMHGEFSESAVRVQGGSSSSSGGAAAAGVGADGVGGAAGGGTSADREERRRRKHATAAAAAASASASAATAATAANGEVTAPAAAATGLGSAEEHAGDGCDKRKRSKEEKAERKRRKRERHAKEP